MSFNQNVSNHSKSLPTMGHGNNFEAHYVCEIMHNMIIENEHDIILFFSLIMALDFN